MHLKRAINKYGIDKFQKEILYECQSEEEMNRREAEIVDEEFISRLDTYNIKLGREGGFDFINQNNLNNKGQQYKKAKNTFIEKLSNDKSYRQKFCNFQKENYKKNNEKRKKGFIEYITTCGGGMKGKTHSLETKIKIGEKNSLRQMGEKNSNYGKCWIYNNNLQEIKSIKKDELQYWLDDGWIKGRKVYKKF